MAFWRYDKEKKEWLKLTKEESNENDIKLEERLIPVLDACKKRTQDDDDAPIVVFGQVGSGKSTLGRLCCRYISNEKFNPRKHMVRDVNDIERVIGGASRGDAIVFDEASGIFSSKDAMTKKTKYAEYVMDVCRQKNLFLVIIAPSLSRLGTVIAIERTLFALRTFRHKKTKKRGHFAFYGQKAKEKLYTDAKKNHGRFNTVMPKWHGEFGMEVTHDEEYRKVKDETLKIALRSFSNGPKGEEKPKSEWEIQREYRLEIVKNNPDKTSKELGDLLGVADRTVREWRARFKEQVAKEKFKEAYGIPS